MERDGWIIAWVPLSIALGIGVHTLKKLNKRISFHLYRKGARVAFPRSQIPTLAMRIYFADNHLRPGSVARMLNTVAGRGEELTADHFKRVQGRWVLK